MAEQIMINAQTRDLLGTRVSRRYRNAGKIPAVLARKGERPLHLLVDARQFGRILKRRVRVIGLEHPAGQDKVFIREVQYDHLEEHPIHVDFSKVAMDELLTLEVPLVLKGKPVGVTEEAGVLDQYVMQLKIQCLPDAIPERIEVDVTSLKKDVNLLVKQVAVPAGVKILNEPDLTVARVTEHKVEEVAPAAAAVGPAEPEVIKKEKAEAPAEEGAEKKESSKKEASAKE